MGLEENARRHRGPPSYPLSAAQIANLLYRRLQIGRPFARFQRPGQGAVLQDGILRYSRLAVCATKRAKVNRASLPRLLRMAAFSGFIRRCLWLLRRICEIGCCRSVVSPHPDPLPRGEGTAFASRVFCAHWLGKLRAVMAQKRRTTLPLPRGEGRDEGNENAANSTVP